MTMIQVIRQTRILALVLLATLFWAVEPAQAQSLVGLWRSHIPTQWGQIACEVIFFPNGSFSKACVLGSLMTRDTGQYTVGEGFVHFNITDHEPKTYMNKPMTWAKSETWFFKFEGANRVIFADRITRQRWTAYRVKN